MTINRDFEGEASVGDPLTHISIKSSWKDESVVFCANLAAGAVEKVISNLRKLTRIDFFCYKRGCDSTTVKLVP
jgi:hypothetical protein